VAESVDKAVTSAEHALAAAMAEAPPANAEIAPVEAVSKSTAEPVSKKPALKASRKASKPRRAAAPKANAAPPADTAPTVTELKEKIMADARNTDYAKPFTDAVNEMHGKTKAAYDKSAELAAEAAEFAKGNLEAVVESGKVYAAGVQTLGKSYAQEVSSAYETFTADLKEFAAVKSPAELFQLQAKLARRNFDALVASSSKNTDAVLKLVNDSFAPISGRVSLAAEKIAKAA
jgi:phasin family protein